MPVLLSLFARFAAALLLAAALPVLLVAALCIVLDSGWPVLFRQARMGRGGRTFTLLKLRSMRPFLLGPSLTATGDPRITAVGAFLRKYKLDELPQLWNVLTGDMQFIGPRPELPELVDLRDPLWQRILSVRPGLTDPSTLLHRNEEALLRQYADPILAYRSHLLPRKLEISARYLDTRTLASDCRVLLLTLWYSLSPSSSGARRLVHDIAGVLK